MISIKSRSNTARLLSLILLLLSFFPTILLAFSFHTAFPSAPVPLSHFPSRYRHHAFKWSGLRSSSVENVSLKPVSPDSPAIVPQTRSIHPNAIINLSLLLLATSFIFYHVLSIDVGITRGWSTEEIAARIPLDNWDSYTHTLHEAPLSTKAVTSATVYTLGDMLAQTQEGKSVAEWDRLRILRSLLAGLIGHGPMSHCWYQLSEDFFDQVLKWHAWWDFLPKVALDQTVFGPIWNNSYIILLGLMQFHKPSQIWDQMKRTTIPLIISGLRLWPFVHCITYGVIPIENRLLWVDAVEIVWVTILATQAASSSPSQQTEQPLAYIPVDGMEQDPLKPTNSITSI